MNASKIANILAMLPLGLLVAGCNAGQPPPEEMVSTVICDGRPYWCIEARSETGAQRPAFIFIDGDAKALILPGRTSRLPVKAGETHRVNFCAYFDVAKQWKCSTPTDTKLDSGNSILVVFPLQ